MQFKSAIFVAKTCKYGIFVAKTCKQAFNDSFFRFSKFHDSAACLAALVSTRFLFCFLNPAVEGGCMYWEIYVFQHFKSFNQQVNMAITLKLESYHLNGFLPKYSDIRRPSYLKCVELSHFEPNEGMTKPLQLPTNISKLVDSTFCLSAIYLQFPITFFKVQLCKG